MPTQADDLPIQFHPAYRELFRALGPVIDRCMAMPGQSTFIEPEEVVDIEHQGNDLLRELDRRRALAKDNGPFTPRPT